MRITESVFVTSAPGIGQSPDMDLPEVLIMGRSNVGKSSLINYLTNRKELAKASKVPGKTVLINFFLINNSWLLVDFPGYGYAKKGKDTRGHRLDTMQTYLTEKKTIKDVLLLINGHLPPQKVDKMMFEALAESDIKFTVVITKTDKAPMKEISKNIKLMKKFMTENDIEIPEILVTSSQKKQGARGLLAHIAKKIGYEEPQEEEISEE